MEKGQLNLKDIARCLQKLRVDNGLTQQALADKLLDFVIKVAEGQETQNEKNGYREISIFKDGIVL